MLIAELKCRVAKVYITGKKYIHIYARVKGKISRYAVKILVFSKIYQIPYF